MPGKGKEKADSGVKKYAGRVSDPRFVRLHSDPRFLRPNREDGKVILDERFKGLLSGKRDTKAAKVDKYGRKAKSTDRSQDDLARLYRVEDEEVEEDESSSSSASAGRDEAVDYARGEGVLQSSGDESSEAGEDEVSDSDDGQDVLIGPSIARRNQTHPDSSIASDDDIDSDDERLAELDARAERAVKQEARDAKRRQKQSNTPFAGDTTRLAAVNMDWDHIRAVDLYKVFSSIVSPAARSAASIHAERRRQAANGGDRPIMPVHGRCLGVRIYPSEFGRKRMAAEMISGPPKEIFKSEENVATVSASAKTVKKTRQSPIGESEDDADTDDEQIYDIDEGGDFDEEALRKYQLDRLRYHYAIATFDSPLTARYVFDQVDGSEMEHTANMFDLSFVPAEMTFPDWQAPNDDAANEGYRDEANERTINDGSYQGVDFATDALRHSKVKLTWDADDPQRAKVTRQIAQKAMTSDQLRDDDFKAYLASASEASDNEHSDEELNEHAEKEEASRDRVRALLGLTDGKDTKGFGKARSSAFADARKTGSHDNEGDMEITFMPGLSEAAERRKKGISLVAEEEETTLAKYKRKQKERRERRKKESVAGAEEVPHKDGVVQGDDITFDDEFFTSGDEAEIDFDAALAAEKSKKKAPSAQSQRQKLKEQNGNIDGADRGELDLIIGSDDELADSRAGHFSLKDILKAEEAADGKVKKGRWAKKKEKKKLAELGKKGENAIQTNFEIDVQDPRFSNLFQDHRYALDPNHPNYIKTKSTQRLVDERRKRTEKEERTSTRHDEKKRKASNGADDDLSHLVQSVKKHATDGKKEKRRA